MYTCVYIYIYINMCMYTHMRILYIRATSIIRISQNLIQGLDLKKTFILYFLTLCVLRFLREGLDLKSRILKRILPLLPLLPLRLESNIIH